MPVIQNALGEMVDLTTGQVVGRAEGAGPAPTESGPPSDMRRAGGPEVELSGMDKVKSLVNNLSWGFNAGLFALPDAAQRTIGKGLGLKEDEVFQFSRFFNRGETRPQNSADRYARAIGEGVGGSLPFTGILAWAARTTPMAKAAEPTAGVLKGIANDAIQFVQRNPRTAAALDVAFGAGYEGLRQAVEENVDPSNPYKDVYKELLPMGAFVGLPVAVSYLPSVKAAGFVKDKIKSASAGLGEIEKETLEGLPGMYKLPVVRVVPQVLMKNAERKLAQVFGPISESKEAQEALKQLEVALSDPRVANAGFMFDAAERTMYAPLVQRKAELLQQLGPKELEVTKARIAENQKKLDDLFNSFSPTARQPIEDAFRAAQQERQSFFESLLKQKKDMTDAEVAAISERLGPQNIDLLNDELRGVLMANMEMGAAERRTILDSMGLRQGTSPEGLPMPTRENGKSLFPAVDIEARADDLISKYRIERPSLRARVPEPIQMLENFVRGQQIAREKATAENVDILLKKAIDDNLAGGRELPPELYENTLKNAKALFTKKGASKKVADQLARELNLQRSAGIDVAAMKEGEVAVSTGLPGRPVYINPKQIQEDAARLAQQAAGVDLNLPEALDYVQAAIRFRNDSLARYNAAMSRGRTRVADAQRFLDTGKAVYDDIEKLVLGSKVLDKEQYNVLKSTLDSYRNQFEKSLPLLTTQKIKGGEEFLLPNEALMQKAFSNAENLRQLKGALTGTPEGESLIERGALDWIRSKGVVDANGLVDPRKMRQVLNKNQNIVDELPDQVRQRFQDEVRMADDYIARLGQIDQRRVTAKDNELDSLLSRAVRPDADAKMIMANALRDPATMRKLVDQLGQDPENLAALRRSVYDVAMEGAKGGGALKTFLDTNEKSLAVLFKNTRHLEDLKTLADLQRRVNAFAGVTGQIPAFESLDEQMRRTFGSGIQWLTTTAREAAVGRINPSTGALALLVRLTGSLENTLYQRIFTRALEDAEFAKAMTQVGTPQQAAKVAAELSKIGISPTTYVPRAAAIPRAEVAQELQETAREPRPAAPAAPTAREMLRTLPPAPPTRGTSFNPRLPTTPPAAPGGAPQVQLMYPSLFPNDPISAMLQARQAQIGQNQPVTPGQ
jgi:hypothetical protein